MTVQQTHKSSIRTAPTRLYGRLCERHAKVKQLDMAVVLDRAVLVALIISMGIMVWGLIGTVPEDIETLDVGILWFFVFEIAMRTKAAGRRVHRDGWLVFDIIIITLALLPLGANLTALRIMRGARLAHVGRHVPHLRHITHVRWVGWLARRIKGTQASRVG